MTLQQRIDNYVKVTGFPRSLFISEDGRIVGTWVMGNDYRVKSQFYGGYPAGYLRRIKALFPEMGHCDTLHVFSGKVDTKVFPGYTLDSNSDLKPDFLTDAHTFKGVPLKAFKIILADPPYSVEDCNHYSCTMVKRNVVMRSLGEHCAEGTFVVWLDQVLPMFRKDQWRIVGLIGMCKSTNHRFRLITIFEHK